MRSHSAAFAATRAPATMRSTRPGGSIPSRRHRANNACVSAGSDSSAGATSSASHAVSLASSPRVASRNPNASRIWARWYSMTRPDQAYTAKSPAGTPTCSAT